MEQEGHDPHDLAQDHHAGDRIVTAARKVAEGFKTGRLNSVDLEELANAFKPAPADPASPIHPVQTP